MRNVTKAWRVWSKLGKANSSVMLIETHTSRSTIVNVRWLDPLVPNRIVRHHIGWLFAYLAIVMHVVSESVSVITLVDVFSILHIVSIETLLHRRGWVHWELRLVMIKVRVFEELDAVWGDRIPSMTQVNMSKLVLLLWSTCKPTISCLEMRSGDVGNRNWIQPCIDLSRRFGNIIELRLHWCSGIKASWWTLQLHCRIRVLQFVPDCVLVTRVLWLRRSCGLKSTLVIGALSIPILT